MWAGEPKLGVVNTQTVFKARRLDVVRGARKTTTSIRVREAAKETWT